MNSDNNLNNESLSENNLNQNSNSNQILIPGDSVNMPTQNILQGQAQIMNNLNQTQPIQDQNKTSINAPKKKKTGVIIIAILVIVVLGYFIYTKIIDGAGACIDSLEYNGSMLFGDYFAIGSNDTQYIFDSKFDIDFLSKVIKFDNVSFKICYTKTNNSLYNFHVGDTTKSKKVESFELYNTNNNKKINSTNINDLLKELGYHSYGKHTEKAKVLEVEKYPSFGFSDGQSFVSYDVNIEFTNGVKVEAKYIVLANQENKIDELENGKEYTLIFEVKEDTFNPVQYVINDFS